MEQDITKWLEKSGYPLELYAVQQLIRRGYSCTKSDLYEDATTGKSRELDVLGDLSTVNERGDGLQLRLLLECKKSDKPFLILSTTTPPKNRLSLVLGQSNDYHPALMHVVYLFSHLSKQERPNLDGLLATFKDPTPFGYSLVKAFANSDSELYGSLLALASAEDYYVQDYKHLATPKQDKRCLNSKLYMLIFPILLVDAPLYFVYLDQEGNIQTESTHWGTIVVRKPWGLGQGQATSIQVIQREYFAQVLSHLEALFRCVCMPEVLHGEEDGNVDGRC